MNKVLITGAFGQLGRAWQTYLNELGLNDLRVVCYRSSDLDITRYDCVEDEMQKHQPDVVINCAAYTKVDQAEEDVEKARQVNSEAVRYLAQCCRTYDTKLVHFSTDYIFPGLKEDRTRFPKGYSEDHPANPVNRYGQTKWEGEQAIRNSNCRHLIIRVSWLCGVHGNNFVKTMLKLAAEHSEINVVNDQTGSPTFASGLVKNVWQIIENGLEGTYHCSTKGLVSWADFAEAIFEYSHKDVTVQRITSDEYPTPADRPFYSKLDTGKAEQVEGVQMEGWETGLAGLLKEIDS